MVSKTMEEISKEVTRLPMDHKLNIFQRMLKAQTMIGTVAKNLTVETANRKYNAVCEKDILDAVKKVESECGIYSYPVERKVYENKVTTSNGKEQQWIRLEVNYRFINIDDPNEFIDVKSYGDGVDMMDKAPGKAMTYADKYALMKAYKISTGDDPDANPSEPQQTVPSPKQAPKPPKEKDDMGILLMEYKECQRKLADLGVDIHADNIKQWMSHYTGYPDQEASLEDYDKMRKLIMAYNTLIRGKEQVNG